MGQDAPTPMCSRDRLAVWARALDDGAVRISGHDLGVGRVFPGATELEYAFTIAARDVPRLVSALEADGARAAGGGGDVLALLAAHGDPLVTEGESTWLGRHGIGAEYWQRLR